MPVGQARMQERRVVKRDPRFLVERAMRVCDRLFVKRACCRKIEERMPVLLATIIYRSARCTREPEPIHYTEPDRIALSQSSVQKKNR